MLIANRIAPKIKKWDSVSKMPPRLRSAHDSELRYRTTLFNSISNNKIKTCNALNRAFQPACAKHEHGPSL